VVCALLIGIESEGGGGRSLSTRGWSEVMVEVGSMIEPFRPRLPSAIRCWTVSRIISLEIRCLTLVVVDPSPAIAVLPKSPAESGLDVTKVIGTDGGAPFTEDAATTGDTCLSDFSALLTACRLTSSNSNAGIRCGLSPCAAACEA